MATFSGKSGTVKASNTANLNVRSWSITETCSVAQGGHSSCSGTPTAWKDAKGGHKSWSGSFEFYQVGSGSVIQPQESGGALLEVGDRVTFEFSDGTHTYGANASTYGVVTSVTYGVDIEGGGLVSGSCAFTGAGALLINGS